MRNIADRHRLVAATGTILIALAGTIGFIQYMYMAPISGPSVVPVSYERKDVYFNRPKILYVGESTEIQAVVDAPPPPPVNIEATPPPAPPLIITPLFKILEGDLLVKSIQAHKFLSAKLIADPYLISITPKDELLRQVTEDMIIWTWYVRPLRVGNISITLDIFSQDTAVSGSPVSEARVMHETWTAEARGWEWLKYQVAEIQPIYAAVAAITAGIVGLIGFFFKKRQSEEGRS